MLYSIADFSCLESFGVQFKQINPSNPWRPILRVKYWTLSRSICTGKKVVNQANDAHARTLNKDSKTGPGFVGQVSRRWMYL